MGQGEQLVSDVSRSLSSRKAAKAAPGSADGKKQTVQEAYAEERQRDTCGQPERDDDEARE